MNASRAARTDAIAAPADDLCLAFANTRYWRGSASPTEELRHPPDLLAWLRSRAGFRGDTLERWQAETGPTLLAEALTLREAIYRVFSSAAAGHAASAEDLAAVNEALASAPGRTSLRRNGDVYEWELGRAGAVLTALLAPVLWSAGDLLAGSRLARVRRCANDQCLWLFLDDSKSGNRRWCSMSACGNRAKAHRHYAKRRQERGPQG